MDSLLCPWGKKAPKFSPYSIHLIGTPDLIQTPYYYGQFALSLGKESPYIFSKFNPCIMCISLASLHDYDVKIPNFTFCGGREYKAMTFVFFS